MEASLFCRDLWESCTKLVRRSTTRDRNLMELCPLLPIKGLLTPNWYFTIYYSPLDPVWIEKHPMRPAPEAIFGRPSALGCVDWYTVLLHLASNICSDFLLKSFLVIASKVAHYRLSPISAVAAAYFLPSISYIIRITWLLTSYYQILPSALVPSLLQEHDDLLAGKW